MHRRVVHVAASASADPLSSASSTGGRTDARKRRNRRRRKGNTLGSNVDSGPGSAPPPPTARARREGSPAGTSAGRGRISRVPRSVPRRPPRSAAVALTCGEGGPTYADALRRARELVSLQDLNIEHTRIRRAATGAMLIELPGDEAKEKADLLAGRLRDALADMGISYQARSYRGTSSYGY